MSVVKVDPDYWCCPYRLGASPLHVRVVSRCDDDDDNDDGSCRGRSCDDRGVWYYTRSETCVYQVVSVRQIVQPAHHHDEARGKCSHPLTL